MGLTMSKAYTYAPPQRKKITRWRVSVALGLQSATGSDLNASSPS